MADPLEVRSLERVELRPVALGSVAGNGTYRDLEMDVAAGIESPEVLEQVRLREMSVVQLYPKGPYGPVTDAAVLKTNTRRPRPEVIWYYPTG